MKFKKENSDEVEVPIDPAKEDLRVK